MAIGTSAILFSTLAGAQQAEPAGISRGAYLARAADCIACHTAGPGHAPFAGGLAIHSPFGIIYSTNITPDKTYGIGQYSLEDFSLAVRNGIAKDGKKLYPAMPYPSFIALTDDDIRALYAYFMHEVKPVSYKPPETRLPFPFGLRWNLLLWDVFFVNHEPFKPRQDRDEKWNRGAYLVRTLGHCGACHTPRGLAFQELAYSETSPNFLRGAVVDNWYSGNLRGDLDTGLGRWSENDIAAFLKTGHGAQTAAFGSMIEVIENSTQYLHRDDLLAIARYLKSLPAYGKKTLFKPDLPAVALSLAAMQSGEIERPGVGLYQSFCAKCHQTHGKGKPDKYPKLTGDSSVLAENPTSLIRLMLEGGKTAQTKSGPKPEEMPGFADKFTDQQIAEVLSFVRNSWGNNASRVTARQVSLLRKALQKKR